MNSQELAAVYYNLPVKVAIINNQYLGWFANGGNFLWARYSHSSMAGSGFCPVSRAYGLPACVLQMLNRFLLS